MDCMMNAGVMQGIWTIGTIIIDTWGAIELYRWAKVKKDDLTDLTATYAK